MIWLEQDTVTLKQTQTQSDYPEVVVRRREDTSVPATPVEELHIPVYQPRQETIVPYRIGYRLPDSLYKHLIARRDSIRAAKAPLTLVGDSIATDSVANDSVTVAAEPQQALVITPAGGGYAGVRPERDATGMWGMVLGVTLLFVVVCLKYRKNSRYMRSLMRDLYEVRERHNMFDDTVRERWFTFLLNLLCTLTTGILLAFASLWFSPARGTAPGVGDMLSGIAIAAVYTLFEACIYWVCGQVFSDGKHTGMWLRSYWAAQSLAGVCLFVPLLLLWFNPQWSAAILWVCGGIWLLIKIAFISKGFRIFFAKGASLLPFLYYLCSAEAVPAILVWVVARLLIVENVGAAWLKLLGEWASKGF